MARLCLELTWKGDDPSHRSFKGSLSIIRDSDLHSGITKRTNDEVY